MNGPSVPNATDTSNAQTASNIKTATAQQNLNQVDQVTPTGSLKYTQTGTNADGTPKYTATTSLTAPQQQLLDTNQGTAQSLANTGSSLAGQVSSNYGQPLDWSAQQGYLNNLTDSSLDNTFDRSQTSLEQQLANKGIKPGTAAYENAQRDFTTNKGAAYNAANVQNYNTALASQLQLRNEPLNELTALGGGTAITPPNFTQTPQSGVNPTDVSGNVNTQYQAQQAQSNQFWNGVGALGSTAGGWLFSDEKLKTDIHDTGMKTPDGIPMKTFRYRSSPMMELGVTAQDTMKKRPDAVRQTPQGKQVNYSKIGSPMLALGRKVA